MRLVGLNNRDEFERCCLAGCVARLVWSHPWPKRHMGVGRACRACFADQFAPPSNFGVGGLAGKSSCGAGGKCCTCATGCAVAVAVLRRCWRLGRRFLSGRCLAQMLRYDLACTLRALTGDGKREVREFCRREPQRTGAEVAARAAIGVRIFQHVREVGHGANFSTARPLPHRLARSAYPPIWGETT